MANAQRKYICSFCAKSFSRSEHRTRHERSHTGYKPFQCKICKHSFVRRDLVQRHIRTVHRVLLLAHKKELEDSNNDGGTLASGSGAKTTIPTQFTFVKGDTKISDTEGSPLKSPGPNKSNGSRKSSPDATGDEDSDDQALDNLVRQMINIRDTPKDRDPESPKRGKSSSISISSSSSSNATTKSDSNNSNALPSVDGLSTSNRQLNKDMSSAALKQIYLNPMNDFYNSHLTAEVIAKFHLSYYSDQLIKNFNAGVSFLCDKQLFVNSLWTLFQGCECNNDLLFKKVWFAENANSLPLLGITLSCLGNAKKNNVYDQNLWVLCWNQAMSYSSEFGKPNILAISILIHIILEAPQSQTTCLEVFQFFQQSLLYMINQLDNTQTVIDWIDVKSFDIWNMFDIWVLLIKTTDTFDNASSIIYKWFLKQNNLFPDFSELTLYDFLNSRNYVIEENMPLATLNTLPDTLYCEAYNTLFNSTRNIYSVGSFKSTEDLHSLIIKINQKFSNLTMKNVVSATSGNLNIKRSSEHLVNVHDPNYNLLFQEWKKNILLLRGPTRFNSLLIDYAILPQSNNHWLLWESTWYEFLKNLAPSELLYKKASFIQMQTIQNVYLDGSMINNNIALCTIPIIALLENNSKNTELYLINDLFVPYIIDVMAFQLKFFSSDLVSSQINGPTHIMGFLGNPMVQLLLYVWYSVIYKNNGDSQVTSTIESDSVAYFVEKYIINTSQEIDADKLLEQDINEILFNTKSSSYVGFHCLIDSIASYIKNEVIIKKLFPIPSISQERRFKLFEFLKMFEPEDSESSTPGNSISAQGGNNFYSHRPSISSIGSNPLTLPTSPMSATPNTHRRSSVISVTEDGQKLLLPPLNFVPGQLLASPSNKRNSVPNNSIFENTPNKVPYGTFNDTYNTAALGMQTTHSGVVNHLNNYSYGGLKSQINPNHVDPLKFNPHALLHGYDDESKPPPNWLQSRRASLPSLSGGKQLAPPLLPVIQPITVATATSSSNQVTRPTIRVGGTKNNMSPEDNAGRKV
ncbi:hypothetical protein DAKH74_004220 [Maudiozyma humilis]|uniref:C2H2-type domain-containing protein n=1 Tax=Maudiozyma humilis TaxID=51915 RepID=A0AAV5RQK2_MAUHU|nr:hypothetical protein DAKH74_004220 [Kazachstania humilis]